VTKTKIKTSVENPKPPGIFPTAFFCNLRFNILFKIQRSDSNETVICHSREVNPLGLQQGIPTKLTGTCQPSIK